MTKVGTVTFPQDPYRPDPLYQQPPAAGYPPPANLPAIPQPPYAPPPSFASPVPASPIPAMPLQYSQKSKVAAGCLQLFPGFFLCFGGIGRLYAGHTAVGVVQIMASMVGWMAIFCGFFLIFPFFFAFAIEMWFVIDGIILMAGTPRDGFGLPMR